MNAGRSHRPSPRLAWVVAALAVCGCGTSTPTTRTHRRPAAVRGGISLPGAAALIRRVRVGTSVQGRAITAIVVGSPNATDNVLIVGCVHGNEPAGEAITRYLRNVAPPAGVSWWLVDEFNPDGCTANTRDNANGVDLNRNSAWSWRPLFQRGSIYWSGRGPLSEPESRAIHDLVLRIQPDVSIWYHQHAALVDSSSGGSHALEALYARISGLPLFDYGVYPGSITTWQNATFPDATAFVVELPPGVLPVSAILRHAAAVQGASRMVTER